MLQGRGRGDVCLERSGAREACCGPGDVDARGGVEVWSSGGALQALPQKRYGDLELWRRVAGVRTCRRYRGIELEVRCRRRDIEVWRPGALEACCGCRDVSEASRYGGLEMHRRRVDV